MGSLQAAEMAELTDIRQGLAWHLQGNHYPPVPVSMVDACIEAIEAANADDWDQEIELPDGVSYKGRATAPAFAIIDSHHLQAFLDHEID